MIDPAPDPSANPARTPYAACPLCDSPRMRRLAEADCTRHALYQPALPPTLSWMQCQACAHVFTSGHFTEAALEVLFSRVHPGQSVGHDFERQRVVSARMVSKVARHQPSGVWLDVGFGNGALLLTAAEWGYRPVGLDLRRSNVEALRALGCEARCEPLETYRSAVPVSVISLADVLEHIPYPRIALAAADRLLAADGVLFVSAPAFGSPVWRMMDAAGTNPYWGELEHYHNFNRQRLCALAADHGFEMAEYGVSERYRACMEIVFRRRQASGPSSRA